MTKTEKNPVAKHPTKNPAPAWTASDYNYQEAFFDINGEEKTPWNRFGL